MDCLGILATLSLDFWHITLASMFVFTLFLNLITGLNRLFCPSRVAALSVSLFSRTIGFINFIAEDRFPIVFFSALNQHDSGFLDLH